MIIVYSATTAALKFDFICQSKQYFKYKPNDPKAKIVELASILWQSQLHILPISIFNMFSVVVPQDLDAQVD